MMLEKNWRDLIQPKALDVDKESLSTAYGKFVAKPLERGFGLTLGNSLRRVLAFLAARRCDYRGERWTALFMSSLRFRMLRKTSPKSF